LSSLLSGFPVMAVSVATQQLEVASLVASPLALRYYVVDLCPISRFEKFSTFGAFSLLCF
jgi:hypothetical protein